MSLLCCKKSKPPETERRIKANSPEYNASFQYANNHIRTFKYTVWSFLPLNLFEQFKRLANAYFLGLLILQLIPAISSLAFYTTLVPLVFVLCVTAVKDIYDDVQRHRSDNQVNGRESTVLRERTMSTERWDNVVAGDIIKMSNNQFVAADLLLLSSSEPNSLCYIETAELDGETNLKVRQAIPDLAELGDDDEEWSKFDGEVVGEAPNNNLTKFDATLFWKGEKYALDNEKILLRGCVLRNTEWCYGLVIYAGPDSKLMQNSGKTVFKRTNIDRQMNIIVLGILIVLLSLSFLTMIGQGVWETIIGYHFQIFLPWEDFITDKKSRGATEIALLVFFSYIILLNTVVPISLYVSVEIIRLANSLFINWDVKMYFEPSDTPAKARTTTLNEELGQIEYIFSDKTGTLTQNIMEFKKCSVNGLTYCDASSESTSENGARNVKEAVKNNNSELDEFFRLLAICHTVMPEEEESGFIKYQAQSPDEGALVSAARDLGYVFQARTPSTITINVRGQEESHELLCILDFNNVRKRMSVITRFNGRIRLYCKGADSLIYERLSSDCSDLMEVTQQHLDDFAHEGLRTLCLSVKNISKDEWSSWSSEYQEASTALDNRDEKLHNVYEAIEQNMKLLGATAIEDKLQDGVPETIANLEMAGIKIWVLTGDKQETAINIGYSSNLLQDSMEEVFIIDGENFDDVSEQLKSALTKLKQLREDNRGIADSSLAAVHEGDPTFALVVNGHSLVYALEPRLEEELLELGCECAAVICCRVTPLQKALVVELVKRNKSAITLSIGDGANDVSMIKTAHIGVGISGQEGLQAVLASDYSIGQFRYLERLLLVHGRWSYYRMSKFLRYFFYKNFAFTFCHFWFGFFCGFSAQAVFDAFFISTYNIVYTSLPVLCLGMFDKDVDEKLSIRYPKLYTAGMKNLFFNTRLFFMSVGEGVLASIALFFISYLALRGSSTSDGKDLADMNTVHFTAAAALVSVVNVRVALETVTWTGLNFLVVIGSILVYYLVIPFYTDVIRFDSIGVAEQTLVQPSFWLVQLICVVLIHLPILGYRFIMLVLRPTLTDRVRHLAKSMDSRKAVADVHMRVGSAMRASRRSLRSGYAFAHTEGFGRLITTGANMRPTSAHSKKSVSSELVHNTVRNMVATTTAGKDNPAVILNDEGKQSEHRVHSVVVKTERASEQEFGGDQHVERAHESERSSIADGSRVNEAYEAERDGSSQLAIEVDVNPVPTTDLDI